MSPPYVVALSTAPDVAHAEAIARALVGEGLAACVNVLPVIKSIYKWEGELRDEPEVLCVIKTRRDRVEAARARLVALHPYDVPEFLVLDVADGHAPYLSWIDASLA